MKHCQNFSLKYYNTLRINSIAKDIWFPEKLADLIYIVKQLQGCKYAVLGGGSNVVILSPIIEAVICMKDFSNDISICGNELHIKAGASTGQVVDMAVKNGLQGIECLVGIPGLIGGAVLMNAGSGGMDVSRTLKTVTTVNTGGQKKVYNNKEMNFSRRYSILQDKKEIIVEMVFNLYKRPQNEIIRNMRRYLDFHKTITKKPSAGGIFKNWHALKPYKKELIGMTHKNLRISNNINIIESLGDFSSEDFKEFIGLIQLVVNEPLKMEVKIL